MFRAVLAALKKEIMFLWTAQYILRDSSLRRTLVQLIQLAAMHSFTDSQRSHYYQLKYLKKKN
jgi:hypothetical protein